MHLYKLKKKQKKFVHILLSLFLYSILAFISVVTDIGGIGGKAKSYVIQNKAFLLVKIIYIYLNIIG